MASAGKITGLWLGQSVPGREMARSSKRDETETCCEAWISILSGQVQCKRIEALNQGVLLHCLKEDTGRTR